MEIEKTRLVGSEHKSGIHLIHSIQILVYSLPNPLPSPQNKPKKNPSIVKFLYLYPSRPENEKMARDNVPSL